MHVRPSSLAIVKSLTALGLKIRNQLPTEKKSEPSFLSFKEYQKTWFVPGCKCNACRTIIQQSPEITNNFIYTYLCSINKLTLKFVIWFIVIYEICQISQAKSDFAKSTEILSEICKLQEAVFEFPPYLDQFCQINYLCELSCGYPSHTFRM